MDDTISRAAAIDAVKFGITYAKAINKSTGEVKELFKEGNKALNEAVERIKDLPSAQPDVSDTNDGDMISRAQAMTEIQMNAKRLTLAYEAHAEGHVQFSDLVIGVREASGILRNLPSAQPVHHGETAEMVKSTSESSQNVPYDDLISRKAAIDAVTSLCDDCDSDYCGSCRVGYPGEKNCRKVLEDLPSAQPEIVRCKDCKYFELDHFEKVDEFPIPIIVAHEICMKWGEGCRSSVDGWCFMAERKTDGIQNE